MTGGSSSCLFSQVVTEKEVTSASADKSSRKGEELMDDLAAAGGSPEVLLANVVRGLEGKEEDRAADEERGPGESTRGGVGMFAKRKDLVFSTPTASEYQNNKND